VTIARIISGVRLTSQRRSQYSEFRIATQISRRCLGTDRKATMNMHPFQVLAETGSRDGYGALLAAEVTLHSPILHSPITGHQQVAALLPVLRANFEEFDCVADFSSPGARALLCSVRISGLYGQNLQVLSFDNDGLITDITIFVRPLTVALAVVRAVGLRLEERDDGSFGLASATT
jgi:hypothetical protein